METALLKNAGACQDYNQQAAGKVDLVPNTKNLSVKPKFKKFPEFCDECGGSLAHDDLIGKYANNHTVFRVLGYYCPHCDHKVGRLYHKNWKESLVRFNWKVLSIPRQGKQGCIE